MTAAVHREEESYIARCLEIDVASQGQSVEEATANLAEAVALYLEESDGEPEANPLVTSFQIDAA